MLTNCTDSVAAGEPPNDSEALPARERVRAVIAREYKLVWRFLRRLGISSCDADDAAQITLARVLSRQEVIEPNAERAYVMKAAFRLSLEYRRSKSRADARHSDCDIDSLVNRFPAPDEALSMRQERKLLELALEKLTPEMRAAFVLFELEGMTFSEIAESLGIPRGTVASRVRRARLDFTKAVQRLAPKGER